MVNQAFRIKIAYRSKEKKKEKKEKKEKKKIPGIGRYPMGPTKSDKFGLKSIPMENAFNKQIKYL